MDAWWYQCIIQQLRGGDRWWTKILSLSLYLHKTHHTRHTDTSHRYQHHSPHNRNSQAGWSCWEESKEYTVLWNVNDLKASENERSGGRDGDMSCVVLFSCCSGRNLLAQHIHEVPPSWSFTNTNQSVANSVIGTRAQGWAIDERQIAPPSITYQWQIENIFWAEIYGKTPWVWGACVGWAGWYNR